MVTICAIQNSPVQESISTGVHKYLAVSGAFCKAKVTLSQLCLLMQYGGAHDVHTKWVKAHESPMCGIIMPGSHHVDILHCFILYDT